MCEHLFAGQVLERRWFAGRRCLDIGCNEGLVTLAVAARFGAASMLGVDLDEHLIRNACRRGTPCHASRRPQGVFVCLFVCLFARVEVLPSSCGSLHAPLQGTSLPAVIFVLFSKT